MRKTETRAQPEPAETAEDQKPETQEDRDARELAEMGPELKAAFDRTWEQNLPALRYLADR